MYFGMNAANGRALSDLSHIQQSVTDILNNTSYSALYYDITGTENLFNIHQCSKLK